MMRLELLLVAAAAGAASEKGPQLARTQSCARYLLLTSQRSGSTWTCQVLDSQPGLACGVSNSRSPTATTSEMLIAYSKLYPADEVSWESWEAHAEHAFDALDREKCAGRRTVGFKLMYDQAARRRPFGARRGCPTSRVRRENVRETIWMSNLASDLRCRGGSCLNFLTGSPSGRLKSYSSYERPRSCGWRLTCRPQ